MRISISKSFVALMLTLVLILSNSCFVVFGADDSAIAAPVPNEDTRYYLNLDFSDTDLSANNIAATLNGGKAEIIDETVETGEFDLDGNPILKPNGERMLRVSITPTKQGEFPKIAISLPFNIISGKVVYEWDARVNNLSTNTTGTPEGAVAYAFTPGSGLKLGSGTSTYTLAKSPRVDQWYHFTYVLDYDQKYFDLYLNGKLVVAKEAMTASSTGTINFSGWPNAASSTLYTNDYKNIKVYDYPVQSVEDSEPGQDEQPSEALATLRALGIWTEDVFGAFDDDKPVTRGEILRLLPRLHGIDEMHYGDNAKQVYHDIDLESPYAYAADYVHQAGLMSGYGDGCFYPDKAITVTEVLKPFITLLGYTQEAINRGGWPAGYTMTASRLGITRGIASGEQLSQGVLAEILYNLLEVNIVKPLIIADEANSEYAVEKGATILSEYLQIGTGTGIMTGNSVTGLNSRRSSTNTLEIDYVKYENDNRAYDAFVGYRVRYYVDSKGDKDKILYVAPYQTETLTVLAENIVTDRGNDTEFVYEDATGEEEKITIGDQRLIYNEVATGASYTLSNLQPKSGSVTFIDNDFDGEYDIISVVSYDNFVVLGASEKEGYIYRKYGGGGIKLSKDYVVYRQADKKEVDLSAVTSDKVVAVMQSLDGQHTKVYVLSKMVSGMVTGIQDEGSVRHYTIQSAYETLIYDKSAQYHADAPEIALNYNGHFLLDIDGNILAPSAETDANASYRVGYLMKVGVSGGIDTRVHFRILDSKLGVVELQSTPQVMIDNDLLGEGVLTKLSGQKLVDELRRTATNKELSLSMSTAANQVIAYKVNADNELTAIDRRIYSCDIAIAERYLSLGSGSCLYGEHEGPFLFKPDTVIFVVPPAKDTYDASGNPVLVPITIPDLNADPKRYKVTNMEAGYAGGYVMIEAYNFDDMGYVDVAVICGTPKPKLDGYVKNSIVTEIADTVNEFDERIKMVKAISTNGETTFYVDPQNDIETPKIGDFIRYTTDTSNVLNAISVDFSPSVYSAENLPSFTVTGSTYVLERHVTIGSIYNIDASGLVMTNLRGTTELNNTTQLWPYRANNTPIYVYHVASGKIYPIDWNDLSAYKIGNHNENAVYVRASGGNLSFVYVVDYSE